MTDVPGPLCTWPSCAHTAQGQCMTAMSNPTNWVIDVKCDYLISASIPGRGEFFKVTADGKIQVADWLTPDDAALAFLESLSTMGVMVNSTPTNAQVMANPKVRALVEALEKIAGDAESHQSFYDRNGPQWTSPHGNEYEDTSAFLDSHNKLARIARAALRDLT